MSSQQKVRLSDKIMEELLEAEAKGANMTMTKALISDWKKADDVYWEKKSAEETTDKKWIGYTNEYIKFLDNPNKEQRIAQIINQILSSLIILKNAPWAEKKAVLEQIKSDLAADEAKIVPPLMYCIKKEYRFIFIQAIDKIGEFLEKEGDKK